MVEGLEVVIKYRGPKHYQVASPATPSAEFAILKKDLAHLRVHSPSQKNVRREGGSFVLHWPTASTNPKVQVISDSLRTRWFKLCSDDPEALKLRKFLSIKSITMVQDDVLIRSTIGALVPPGAQLPPGATFVNELFPEAVQQHAPASTSTPMPIELQPSPFPPQIALLSDPKSDRLSSSLKRRMDESIDGTLPPNPTRPKLDMPETQAQVLARSQPASPVLTISDDANPPTSPRADCQRGSTSLVSVSAPLTNIQIPAPAPAHTHTHTHSPTTLEPPELPMGPPSSPREPGETRPHTPVSAPVPAPAPALALTQNPIPFVTANPAIPNTHIPVHASSPNSVPPSAPTGPRAPLASYPPHSPAARPGSPYPSSSSSNGGDPHRPPRGSRADVSRLTRELWDTRRQLTAMQAREQVILNELDRLGARPEATSGPVMDRRDEVMRLEADLRAERVRRVRAERALNDVERECRAPFVVPALFQAFLNISELSN